MSTSFEQKVFAYLENRNLQEISYNIGRKYALICNVGDVKNRAITKTEFGSSNVKISLGFLLKKSNLFLRHLDHKLDEPNAQCQVSIYL